MQTFEYKTILISDDEDPVPILNAEGQNGWEVIFIEYDYAHIIWMKRRLDRGLPRVADLQKVQGTTVNTKFKNITQMKIEDIKPGDVIVRTEDGMVNKVAEVTPDGLILRSAYTDMEKCFHVFLNPDSSKLTADHYEPATDDQRQYIDSKLADFYGTNAEAGCVRGYMLTHPTKSGPTRSGRAWRWLVRCSTHQGAKMNIDYHGRKRECVRLYPM